MAAEAIRRKVFELYGAEYQETAETDEDDDVCPGEAKCEVFNLARVNTGDGNIACSDCRLLPTKPVQITSDSTGVDSLVWETELLINDENAGFAIDWDFTDAEIFYDLVLAWRNAEREVERERSYLHHLFLKSHFKEK